MELENSSSYSFKLVRGFTSVLSGVRIARQKGSAVGFLILDDRSSLLMSRCSERDDHDSPNERA
jgi:hypothetical protein